MQNSNKTDEEQLINISSEVNEIYSKTEIRQKFTNNYSSPVEIKVQFPILIDYNLSKFKIKIDDKIIISKILEIEKGEEKYNDEISSGNTAFLGKMADSGKKMEINIGNLLPKKTLEIKTEYFQIIHSEDMSYCFSLIQSFPKIKFNDNQNNDNDDSNNHFKGIKWNIYISTRSPFTRFVLLNKRKDFTYHINFSNSLTFAKVFFEKSITKKFKFLPYSCLKILFRTENINIPTLYAQYDQKKNETSYILHYMYSNIQVPSKFTELINSNNEELLQNFSPENFIDTDPKICNYDKYGIQSNDSYPQCYIFLIDQSGSMHGKPIEILKETLILFLKSLPFNSYFQIIGFDNCFRKYNPSPIKYSEKNIEDTIDIISKISECVGGTFLYDPLEEIYKQNYSQDILNIPLNVVIITDGKVFNVGKCVDIIRENNEMFRVHAIGIGENYDKKLVEEMANAGRGLKFFIKNTEQLSYRIFKILNIYSMEYLKNMKIEFLNNLEYFNKIKYNIIPYSAFTSQNDIISYGFICPGEIIPLENLIKINIKYDIINNKNNIIQNKNFEFDLQRIEKLNEGNELSKIIIGLYINNNSVNKKLSNKEIIELSKSYEVLSKYTCLFGSFENSEKSEGNGLIYLDNFYLADNISPNVKISKPKTGKHGHAKILKTVLNEEENSLNELIEDNFDNETNNEIDVNSEDFKNVKLIIISQDVNSGSWEDKIFKKEAYEIIYQKIEDYFSKQSIKKDIFKNICCTFYIIYILQKDYSVYTMMWNQIVNKGKQYLNNNGFDYNEIINKNNFN